MRKSFRRAMLPHGRKTCRAGTAAGSGLYAPNVRNTRPRGGAGAPPSRQLPGTGSAGLGINVLLLSPDSFELFQIDLVLGPGRCGFIFQEMIVSDERYFPIADLTLGFAVVALLEGNPINTR